MPRPKKSSTVAPTPPNSLVASAARIVAKRKDRPLGTGPQPWQIEAWNHYDICTELSAATQWTANAMSQVKLRLVEIQADGSKKPVPADAVGLGAFAQDAMDALFDGGSGQAQMMAAFGVHLSIPGEAYLVGLGPNVADGDMGRDMWRIVSNDELRETSPGSGTWQLDRGDGQIELLRVGTDDAPVENEALIIRVWRSHPRKYVEATSPVRAALPVLRQIEGLAKHDASGIDSRLAGAGILLVPSEMTFQTPGVDGQPPSDAEVDEFLAALAQAMAAALADQGSAAARVPIVVKAPGQFLDSVKHITFESKLDDQASEKMEKNIRRLAIGLDMPPEELLGKGDSNHWTGWLVSEDGIKIHIDPLASLVAEAIQTRYLWPAMQGPAPTMDPEIKRYRLEADTTALRQRTLDFAQTMEMWKAFLISDEAMLRESRFGTGDAPADEERVRRFRELIAAQGGAPDFVAAAIDAVADLTPIPQGEVGNPTSELGPASGPQGTGPTAAPTLAPAETPRTPPEPAGMAAAAAVEACSELLVARAVERAWNRLGKRGTVRRGVEDVTKVEAALSDAWGQVPATAAKLGVDPVLLQTALHRYAAGLLVTGAAHDPSIFSQAVTRQVLPAPGLATVA